MFKTGIFLCLLGFLATGCTDTFQEFEARYGDFLVDVDRKIAVFEGELDTDAHAQLVEMLNTYASIELINFGPTTDNGDRQVAFDMAEMIKSKEVNTGVIDRGSLSNLATFVFLGGKKRGKTSDGKIGVSSWKTTAGEEANTLDIEDEAHMPFIDFLQTIGYNETDAKAFYFFAINAADSNELHSMTNAELDQFNILN